MLDADIPKQPGIYGLEHHGEGKVYLGSTVNLERRIRSHYNYLRTGKHHNQYLQKAFDKHGRLAFKVVILEVLPGATSTQSLTRNAFGTTT